MARESVYVLAADLVLLLHVLFVAFVVVGLVLIFAGYLLAWRWVRRFWFRAAHLAAIAVVVVQAWLGVLCPLTILEMALRECGGDATYTGSFIAHWLESILYYRAPAWAFTAAYTAFGLLVLLSWVCVPPGRYRKGQARTVRR
ncbi:MAG: DUF2784 domain-containing protein [Pseudomonadota bacterium]